jgi:hypothetical protein
MLLTAEQDDVVSGGLGVGNNFSIANSAKAFEVLSSTLYQDKIGAVVRELICNAIDAHTLVGKPWDTIKVTLPTYSSPTFVVEDYGPGLSDEDVRLLYTTYFRSTKDQDNSAIGGFGLGSKSPFAVADQFTVESRFKDEANTYICYKSSGIPAINHVSRRPLNVGETCGLTVQVPVSGTEFSTWRLRYDRFMSWQPETPSSFWSPHAVALTSSTLAPHNNQPLWFLSAVVTEPYAFVGRVAYKLNLSAIPNVPAEVVEMFSTTPIVINVPIGSVQVAPNRESLSYDPTTCKTILSILKSAAKDLLKEFTDKIAAATTLWEAMQIVHSTTNGNSALQRLLKNASKSILWQGASIPQAILLEPSSLPPYSNIMSSGQASPVLHLAYPGTFTRYTKYSYGRRPSYSSTSSFRYKVEHDYRQSPVRHFHAETVTSKTYRVIAQWFATNQPTGEQQAILFGGCDYAELEAALTKLGLPAPMDTTTLPAPPPPVRASKKSPRTMGYEWKNGGLEPSATAIDLTAPGYYVNMFGGKTVGISESELSNVISRGYLTIPSKLVGFKQAQLEQKRFRPLLTKLGWQQLTSYNLPTFIGEKTLKQYYFSQRLIAQGILCGPSQRGELIFKGAAEIVVKLPHTIVGKYLTRLLEHTTYGVLQANYLSSLSINTTYEDDDPIKVMIERAKNEGIAEADAFVDEWRQIKKQFPMLQILQSEFDSKCIDILNTYLT